MIDSKFQIGKIFIEKCKFTELLKYENLILLEAKRIPISVIEAFSTGLIVIANNDDLKFN